MQVSQNGKLLIISNEGTCLTVKPDNKGPQIGHGHDLTPAELASGTVYGISFAGGITEEQADFICDQDLATIYDPALTRLLPPTATQNQIDACGDFAYNEGILHLATMLNHGWDQVPNQMPFWVYAMVNGVETKLPGLIARRAKEVALWNTP